MRVVLTPQGTHGDVRPLVALGRALAGAGHQVVLAAPPNFRAWIEALGLSFRSVGPDFETPTEEADRAVGHPLRSVQLGLRLLGEAAEAQFAELPAAAEDADLIVGSGLEFAGRSIAEHRGIAYLYACHVPTAIRSRHHPPAGVPYRRFPGWVNRIFWWSSDLVMDCTVGRRIRAHRRRLRLPSVGGIERFLHDRTVLAADELLAPVPADCVLDLRTPYWALDDAQPLDPALESFPAAGPPPVYVGFGSMADPDPKQTLQFILGLPAEVRCVVSNRRARRLCHSDRPNLHWVDSSPHHLLFRRVAAVVHHGGAGTTHAAARAGVPQVIVPHIVDQYYWAERVRALGIGPAPLRRGALSVKTLIEAIEACRPGSAVQRAAADLGQQVAEAAEHSVSNAVRFLETLRG